MSPPYSLLCMIQVYGDIFDVKRLAKASRRVKWIVKDITDFTAEPKNCGIRAIYSMLNHHFRIVLNEGNIYITRDDNERIINCIQIINTGYKSYILVKNIRKYKKSRYVWGSGRIASKKFVSKWIIHIPDKFEPFESEKLLLEFNGQGQLHGNARYINYLNNGSPYHGNYHIDIYENGLLTKVINIYERKNIEFVYRRDEGSHKSNQVEYVNYTKRGVIYKQIHYITKNLMEYAYLWPNGNKCITWTMHVHSYSGKAREIIKTNDICFDMLTSNIKYYNPEGKKLFDIHRLSLGSSSFVIKYNKTITKNLFYISTRYDYLWTVEKIHKKILNFAADNHTPVTSFIGFWRAESIEF